MLCFSFECETKIINIFLSRVYVNAHKLNEGRLSEYQVCLHRSCHEKKTTWEEKISIIVRVLIALLSLRKHARNYKFKTRKEERKEEWKTRPWTSFNWRHTAQKKCLNLELLNVIDTVKEKSVDKYSKSGSYDRNKMTSHFFFWHTFIMFIFLFSLSSLSRAYT